MRVEAETTLRQWATGTSPRAIRATDALRRIEERRGTGKSG